MAIGHGAKMDFDEFRGEMDGYRRAMADEASSLKDSDLVRVRMCALYNRFDTDERQMADRVIAEWAQSEDEAVRFDALVLIREFSIRSAIPALRALQERLAGSATPGAPYESEWAERIIKGLNAHD
jgi:hypothetical protein